jgi:hypothetical protein
MVMDRISSGQMGTRIDRPIDYTREVGQTLDEVKIDAGLALSYDVAPAQSIESKELVGGARNPDELRLGMPEAAHPWSSPMGSAQDYQVLRGVFSPARESRTRQLVDVLQNPPRDISENHVSHMKASFARFEKMKTTLKAVQAQAEHIKHQIVGTHEV